jgi:hypothetical protein
VTEPSAPSHEGATGIYVYGIVAPDTAPSVFAEARGVDATQPVGLVVHERLAAVTSPVTLDEFGEDALERNLQDPAWLEDKVRAHDAVLAAAVGQTTVVPFRFGAIYESEHHVREMLARRRDLVDALTRLAGKVELGVNGYLDRDRFRTRAAATRGAGDEPESSGRAYMQRRRLERELDTAVSDFAADCAHAVHERLATEADDARANPLRPSGGDDAPEMLLNGAYLVAVSAEEAFRASVAELRARYGEDGVVLEVTGPWPPYNFAEAES